MFCFIIKVFSKKYWFGLDTLAGWSVSLSPDFLPQWKVFWVEIFHLCLSWPHQAFLWFLSPQSKIQEMCVLDYRFKSQLCLSNFYLQVPVTTTNSIPCNSFPCSLIPKDEVLKANEKQLKINIKPTSHSPFMFQFSSVQLLSRV